MKIRPEYKQQMRFTRITPAVPLHDVWLEKTILPTERIWCDGDMCAKREGEGRDWSKAAWRTPLPEITNHKIKSINSAQEGESGGRRGKSGREGGLDADTVVCLGTKGEGRTTEFP